MVGKSNLPEELYDIKLLFPHFFNPNKEKTATKQWLVKSAFTTSAVGLLSSFWLNWANKARIYGQENLYKALEGRPKDTPLITVTNHHSCMDEPLIWGCLKNKHLTNNSLMRWALAAHDICFSNKFHALFFAFGKSIPIVRGDGPNQPGMDFALDRLNEGSWLHLYPEGKVNESKENIRVKWGVGRLISECRVPPIVVPIYHFGMDSILPNRKPYIPHLGQKVTVVIGKPIPINDTIEELKRNNATKEEAKLALTNVVQKELFKLRITAEIFHAKHLQGASK